MTRTSLILIAFLSLIVSFSSCRDDDFSPSAADVQGGEVRFNVTIAPVDGDTRGVVEDSKHIFDPDELVHVRAVFDCVDDEGNHYDEVRYGIIRYMGHTSWEYFDGQHSLRWPDNAEKATFDAYYLHGSNGVLTANTMQPKLISDFAYDEIPLHAKVEDVSYGVAVTLNMKRLFAFLNLTEMKEEISDEIWFTSPDTFKDPATGEERIRLNNAFYLEFDPATSIATPVFTQVPSDRYKDKDGNPLVYIESTMSRTIVDDVESPSVGFMLEPGVYHKFSLQYPRSRTEHSTYLIYNRDLEYMTTSKGLEANGRYMFSILKSLGVIVEETPDDGWDEREPTVEIEVEPFLRAIHDRRDYYGHDPETGEEVLVIETTPEGTRLLHNVDFKYEYYDVFGLDDFKSSPSQQFDGNYHYIYHTACPLFYENFGTVTNLGIRDSETKRPLISCQNLVTEPNGTMIDNCYNGLLVGNNRGTLVNIRVDNADMTVQVKTSAATPTQENHNIGLLFGENNGHVYDLSLSGNLRLTVENAPDEDIMPRVMIGGLAAQNIGTINNVTYTDDPKYPYELTDITVNVNCRGANGVYKVGGLAGNNTGNLEEIFIPQVKLDASGSKGLESYIGGIVGDNPNSTTDTHIIDCIVRGELKAGYVEPVLNLNSLSYAGGIAGSMNTQASVMKTSATVRVEGAASAVAGVTYAEGGVFGLLITTEAGQEGILDNIASYGAVLTGPESIGNFAGIAPHDWSHYSGGTITVRKLHEKNVGLVK